LVVALGVVVGDVFSDGCAEMVLAQQHELAEAFALDGADEALSVCVQVRTARWQPDGCNPSRPQSSLEAGGLTKSLVGLDRSSAASASVTQPLLPPARGIKRVARLAHYGQRTMCSLSSPTLARELTETERYRRMNRQRQAHKGIGMTRLFSHSPACSTMSPSWLDAVVASPNFENPGRLLMAIRRQPLTT
jgi:hypothetical protein